MDLSNLLTPQNFLLAIIVALLSFIGLRVVPFGKGVEEESIKLDIEQCCALDGNWSNSPYSLEIPSKKYIYDINVTKVNWNASCDKIDDSVYLQGNDETHHEIKVFENNEGKKGKLLFETKAKNTVFSKVRFHYGLAYVRDAEKPTNEAIILVYDNPKDKENPVMAEYNKFIYAANEFNTCPTILLSKEFNFHCESKGNGKPFVKRLKLIQSSRNECGLKNKI